MSVNRADAADHLRHLHGEGPFNLYAIPQDGGGCVGGNFKLLDDALDWAEKRNAQLQNIYMLGAMTRDSTSHARTKEHIATVTHLVVDIDIQEGRGPVELQQEKILDKLAANRPIGIPEPTRIVFSGGGYQAYWALDDAVDVTNATARDDFESRGKQLSVLLGGDHTHDVSRIYRLPGFINHPNESKRAKGQKPTLAKTVFTSDNRYPLSRFDLCPIAQQDTKKPKVTVDIDTGNIRRYEIEELKAKYPGVHDRVWVIVVRGSHPDEIKSDDSRSSWLFDVVCQLLRADVPDDVIYSLITDKNHGISASVLDKGSAAHKYALKQIGLGKEFTALPPELAEFNQKFLIIRNMGGKARIAERKYVHMRNRHELSFLSVPAFKEGYAHRQFNVGDTLKPLADVWYRHPQSRRFDYLEFAPEVADLPDSVYNTWQGFNVEAAEGDCSLILDHIEKVICDGNSEHYAYLINWLAKLIQQPYERGHVAIVLRGARGAGKNLFIDHLTKILGAYAVELSKPDELTGKFNAHLADTVLATCSESFWDGNRAAESTLKPIITDKTIRIERKGVDSEAAANCLHLILNSNEDWCVPVGELERRFFVLDVNGSRISDFEYFRAIGDALDNGNAASAFLHFLQNHDISNFEARMVPKTDALYAQQRASYTGVNRLIYNLLHDGDIYALAQRQDGSVFVNSNAHLKAINRDREFSAQALRLHRFVAPGDLLTSQKRETVDGRQQRGLWLLPLVQARAIFDRLTHSTGNWDNAETDEWIFHRVSMEGQ